MLNNVSLSLAIALAIALVLDGGSRQEVPCTATIE